MCAPRVEKGSIQLTEEVKVMDWTHVHFGHSLRVFASILTLSDVDVHAVSECRDSLVASDDPEVARENPWAFDLRDFMLGKVALMTSLWLSFFVGALLNVRVG